MKSKNSRFLTIHGFPLRGEYIFDVFRTCMIFQKFRARRPAWISFASVFYLVATPARNTNRSGFDEISRDSRCEFHQLFVFFSSFPTVDPNKLQNCSLKSGFRCSWSEKCVAHCFSSIYSAENERKFGRILETHEIFHTSLCLCERPSGMKCCCTTLRSRSVFTLFKL